MENASSLIFLVILIAIFYFMLIRPQKKRVEQHRALLDSLGVGDEVITIGGLYGRIKRMEEDEIELEVSPGTSLRFVRTAISRRAPEDAEGVEE